MATDSLKIQVLLELSLQQLIEGCSDHILKQTLPLYMRKLNCFMAAVMTEGQGELVIPHALKHAALWQELKQFFGTQNNDIVQLIEYKAKNKFIYAYSLPQYGWLFLGKNQPFSIEIKNELIKLVSQFGRSLRQAEEEDRLKLLHNLINNSSDAILVAKESGQLYYINHQAAKRLGIAQHEAHNHHVNDFKTKFVDDELWQVHLEQLKQVEFLIRDGINVHQKTGVSFPVEVTTKYIKIGDQGFVIANSRDISLRIEAQQQLFRQEEKYRNIIANMGIGLVEVDVDGYIAFANQSFCDMSGYTLAELKGKSYHLLYPAIMHDTGFRQEEQDSGSFETEVQMNSGEKRWWFVSSAPNYNDKGVMTGSIGVHLDITAQKTLEKELASAKNLAERASRAKEVFLANMSHEIRTPLNVIIGMIRQLSKEKLDGKQLFYVTQSAAAANHLLAILNNILDMAKIEAGEIVLENKDISISVLANNTHSILSSQASEKGLEFKVNLSADIKDALIGDEVRIRQVLINLLDNSIKFTEKGFVSLSINVLETTKAHQLLQFDVIDSGIGMSESYITEIFNSFSQEDSTASRKFGGTGLGFTIANDLLKLMGSELKLESSKGKGTSIGFTLQLPLGDPGAITGKTAIVKPMALEGFKVLLVEDNKMNRFITQHSLSYLGCSVMEAENGRESVEMMDKNDFDLVLMDIQMPEMDGMEATQYIRNVLKKNTPIIALTANAFRHDIEKYMAEGMDDYIIKPYDEQDLFRKLNRFYELKKQQTKDNSQASGSNKCKDLYDLGMIKEMSRGNEAFVQKMLNIFVGVVSENVRIMDKAVINNDFETLRKIAHKLKPSIDQMGIAALKEKIRLLEKLASGKPSAEKIQGLVREVNETLMKVSVAVQEKEL
jgi:PAS domain S-box-containing protein